MMCSSFFVAVKLGWVTGGVWSPYSSFTALKPWKIFESSGTHNKCCWIGFWDRAPVHYIHTFTKCVQKPQKRCRCRSKPSTTWFHLVNRTVVLHKNSERNASMCTHEMISFSIVSLLVLFCEASRLCCCNAFSWKCLEWVHTKQWKCCCFFSSH